VESQQTSDSSSERLAGTSSPASSDDFQQDRRDHCGPAVTPNVQPSPARSPQSLPKTSPAVERSADSRVKSPALQSQQVRSEWADYGSKNTADGMVYCSKITTELTPMHQTSPHVSPLPESRRVLTPPIVKAGEMPFISDRTFPMQATTNGGGPTTKVGDIPPSNVAGLPGTGPRSPAGTSKPPPPPRTVSVKSPEVPKSPQATDLMRSYSSSSESSTPSHSNTARSHEYTGDKFETSQSYREPEYSAQMRSIPGQMTHSPRQVVGDYSSQQYPVNDLSRVHAESRSSSEFCSDDVGHSASEPAAVDMLFSYHQMSREAGDGQFSTSTFSSRCSPAVMAPTQPSSSPSPRSAVQRTHYYV